MGVFKIVGVILVLLLWHPACLLVCTFSPKKISLWVAWKSTPSPGSNLLNWCTPEPNEIPWPCYDEDKNWPGVTCLRYRLNQSQWDTWVVGLELDDASISGTLPSGINQLSKLVSLKLTGNPSLSGNLPKELADIPLNILDLHDNGFTGTVPEEFLNLDNLLELDLSGNQLSGDFPFQYFSQTHTLQVFKIARNSYTGIVSNAFENMTQLLTLDLSGNNFTGPPPKFKTLSNSTLYYLNLSHNSFSGLPELSQIFSSWLPPNVGVLDLSGLNIGGALPANWSALSDLLSREELYLDKINISGVLNITSILSSIENLPPDRNSKSRNISVLSLKNNNITDVIFDKQFLNSSGNISGNIKFYLEGNRYCSTVSADADGRRASKEE